LARRGAAPAGWRLRSDGRTDNPAAEGEGVSPSADRMGAGDAPTLAVRPARLANHGERPLGDGQFLGLGQPIRGLAASRRSAVVTSDAMLGLRKILFRGYASWRLAAE